MNVGVLGTGDVGRVLASAFAKVGHKVKMGSRSAGNDKAVAWAKENAGSEGTFADAVEFADVVVIATLGAAAESAIEMAGPQRFKNKVVIDATNPLDEGRPPKLFVGHTDSLGERIQRAIPDAHVVKAFNTVGNPHMFKPEFAGGPPDMFICGDNADAKQTVAKILKEFGWGTADVGGIQSSRYLEPMCMTWVLYGIHNGTWNHAFKLLKK